MPPKPEYWEIVVAKIREEDETKARELTNATKHQSILLNVYHAAREYLAAEAAYGANLGVSVFSYDATTVDRYERAREALKEAVDLAAEKLK